MKVMLLGLQIAFSHKRWNSYMHLVVSSSSDYNPGKRSTTDNLLIVVQ